MAGRRPSASTSLPAKPCCSWWGPRRHGRIFPSRRAEERGTVVELAPTWSVATASPGEPAFEPWRALDSLRPLSDPDLLPTFSGTARYTASFAAEAVGLRHTLDLGEVFEIAEVRLNGVELGSRIAPPYVFDVPAGVVAGTNTIEVDVTNTLGKAQPDYFSAFAQQDPSGLLGPVTIAPLRPKECA